MCGIVAFAGKEMDLAHAKRLMLWTEAKRGGDAFGFAWIDGRGRLRCYKRPGLFANHAGSVEMAWDARMFLGHLRWASVGAADTIANAHPHPCDGGWLVHNGKVDGHWDLATVHGVRPTSHCDSEMLALLMEVSPRRTLADRMAWALALAAQGKKQAVGGLWARPDRLLVARVGDQPLHWCKDRRGQVYVASLQEHLQGIGKPFSFPDNTVFSLRADGGSDATICGEAADDRGVQGKPGRKGRPRKGRAVPGGDLVRLPSGSGGELF
jgi:glucosamine 6-phosphate synthetase-like amidotransferase/phosphosugar isomerase protein